MWDEKLHSSLFLTSVVSHTFYVLSEATVWTYDNKAFEGKGNSPSSHAPAEESQKHGKETWENSARARRMQYSHHECSALREQCPTSWESWRARCFRRMFLQGTAEAEVSTHFISAVSWVIAPPISIFPVADNSLGTDEYGATSETRALVENCTPKQLCDNYHVNHAGVYD